MCQQLLINISSDFYLKEKSKKVFFERGGGNFGVVT